MSSVPVFPFVFAFKETSRRPEVSQRQRADKRSHYVVTRVGGGVLRHRNTQYGYKITGLNFFPLPYKLGNSKRCVVLACALPSIHGYNFKIVGQFGRSFCWKWIVFLFSVGNMLSVNVERCVNVKFCVKLGKSATETYDLLKKVYGDECLSHTQVSEWFKRFKEGREEIGNDQRPGRPSTSKTDANIETVGETVR